MAKPVVDGIERDLANEAVVIRLDALSRAGRDAAMRFGVRAVPTLLVFDGCGTEIDRQGGLIGRRRTVEAVRSAAACAPQPGG